ncbi:MAG: alpha-ketoacid dehydrogenase subunit beta [Candidatus Woesearchaeota archaeon]|nr:MAG: alpha-ketoacid dehydrogenase subunit beta [Candidatus Woesearchaeota archaeon]
MTVMNMVEALNSALKNEMQSDKTVLVLGEDVGVDGGVFRVTNNLLKQFGPERVFDTPLAESGIVGTSIGLSVNGFKPVAEIQFDGFVHPAFDQLISHASRIRNRSRGRFSCPLVVRSPYGGGIKALEHHSEAMETVYVHTPGLKVVIPSSPYNAKGLLISAIRDPDPVIFLEPKKVYRAIKEEVPEKSYTIPLGKANIVQEGSDLTIISFGSMIKTCKEALEQINYSIELIDLQTLYPLDTETIINSVQKTGRCVIVHEAPKTAGIGAEIIARINEKALLSLEAPVERVTGFDTIIPLGKREDDYLPNIKRIKKAVEKVMNF